MTVTAITIEQRITAGAQFDGVAPTTTPATDADVGVQVWPTDTHGGLFAFGYGSFWLTEIQRIAANFGNATSVKITIVNTAGDEVDIYDAASGGTVLITDVFRMSRDEKVKIVTVGATVAMVVRVTSRPLVARPA